MHQLSVLLDSIIEQIDPRVEVVVSDNGSTDSTLEMLIKYSENHHYIRYRRNNENQGFIENYPMVGQMASGKYLWFVGSDDKISPNGIETVLGFLLLQPEIDGLFVNVRLCDYSLKNIGESLWGRLNQETEIITNSREAFVKYWSYSGFFSAAVLRRDLWNAAMAELPWKEYPHFLHMLVAGNLLRRSKKWGFLKDECILYRSGSTDCLHIFGGAYLRIAKEVDEVGKALRYLTKDDWFLTYRAESIAVKLHLCGLMLSNIEIGMPALYRMKLVKKCAGYFWWHIYFWLVILPILIMPKRTLRFVRDVRRNFIKRFE
jgi:glycosyltransferase involved in cell wall biosynthesis